VLIATPIDDVQIVSLLNLAVRSAHPNSDWVVPSKSASFSSVLGAWEDPRNGLTCWVQAATASASTIDQFTLRGLVKRTRSRTIGKAPALRQFDPKSEIAIGWVSQPGKLAVLSGRANSITIIDCPDKNQAFVSRGAIYCQSKTLIKLTRSGAWQEAGDFIVVGKSNSGKFWLIRDKANKSIWLAKFPSSLPALR